MIKKAWNNIKEFGRNCADFGVRNAKRIGAVTTGVSATVMAQAQTADPAVADADATVSAIGGLWDSIAVIVLGVAAVMVVKKFIRRTGS